MLYINEQEFSNGQKTKERTLVNDEVQHVMIRPHIPMEFWEMIHDFSMFLIVDDKHDLGHFSYWNRNDHYYRFKKSPNHPSPFHHYQIGILGLVLAQIGGLFSKALEIKNELTPQKEIPHKFKKIIDLPPQNARPALLPLPQKSPEQVHSKLVNAIESI